MQRSISSILSLAAINRLATGSTAMHVCLNGPHLCISCQKKYCVHWLTTQRRSPTHAAAIALARAKALREALFELATRIISKRAPPKRALSLLREHWITGIKAHELRFRDGRVLVDLRNDALDFDLIASVVAYRMVHQVLPLSVDRLRICHGSNCSWVFIDSSKAGRRRWCDMAVCGNAAKSRRFLARSRKRRSTRR